MKHTLQLLVFYPFIFLLAYLVGCFMNVSFDMTTWKEEILNGIFGFLGGFVFIYTAFLCAMFLGYMIRKTEKPK